MIATVEQPDPADSRLRILHVITRLVVGGAQENTLLTVAGADSRRYDVALASGPSEGPEGSLQSQVPPGVPFFFIPHLVRNPNPPKDLAALIQLYQIMRRKNFHIVHTHTTKAGILGRIAARAAGVPIVVHTPHGHAFSGYLGQGASRALIQVERRLAGWTDRIICLTEAERNDHLAYGIAEPARFTVVHSGVEVDRFSRSTATLEDKKREIGFATCGPLIGCVARLVPVKGVGHLLDAMPLILKSIPDASLVLVGDGPLRNSLEHRAHALGVADQTLFVGLKRNVEELMSLFDVVVIPSLNEGMAKVAVQAMAAGRPVVASDLPALREVLTQNAGICVAPGDPMALSRAVIGLIEDCALRRSLGEHGARRAQDYSLTKMLADLAALYEELWKFQLIRDKEVQRRPRVRFDKRALPLDERNR